MNGLYEFDFPFFGFFPQHPREDKRSLPFRGGLNLYETKDSLVAEAAVPGAKKEEISVEVKEGVLKIDSEHQEKKEEKKDKGTVYRSQLQSAYHYVTTLPKPVEENKARAKLQDGVLTITFPLVKKGQKKGKGIAIEEL
jgi:HSP20 family protein